MNVKLSERSKYYFFTFSMLMVWWGVFTIIELPFNELFFFATAYLWHLALVTPGLRDTVMRTHGKLSFLGMMVRLNYYLQLFINFKKLPFASSFIRAISPLLFAMLLYILGGSASVVYTVFGSLVFEVTYFFYKKIYKIEKISLLGSKDDQETQKENLSEETSHV